MGFVIWYKVQFKEQQGSGGLAAQVTSVLPAGALGSLFPLTVSNDGISGKFRLDAEIKLHMIPSDTVDTFTIKLVNLPGTVAETLKNKQFEGLSKGHKPLLVDIHLGYIDDKPVNPVMTGVVLAVRNTVGKDGLLHTIVEGQEVGSYKLRTVRKSYGRKDVTANDLVQQIAKDADVAVAEGSTLNATLKVKAFALKAVNGLQALRQVATVAQAPLMIRDNKIFIGPSVGRDEAPTRFDPDINLVRLDQVQDTEEIEEIDDADKQHQNRIVRSKSISRLKLMVLGHPGLRVGQKAIVKNAAPGTFRIIELIHNFSTCSCGGGYTCELALARVEAGQVEETMTGAQGIARRLRDLVESVQRQQPAIDVGQVTQYVSSSDKKHRATLNYGQPPSSNEAAPSVEVAVDDTPQLESQPIASPFAWHKCGLIVPVYSGMRALLAHNLGLVNDAVVTGFLWSEQPKYDRPENKPGDYWLCLPTELEPDGKKQPKGKGVNDLIDQRGLRVIQAKGLHIFVGDGKLPEVGKRPELSKAQTIVIEHESGTKITIADDGSLTIETNHKDISITNGSATLTMGGNSSEISLHNDNVTLKLGQSGVEVS